MRADAATPVFSPHLQSKCQIRQIGVLNNRKSERMI